MVSTWTMVQVEYVSISIVSSIQYAQTSRRRSCACSPELQEHRLVFGVEQGILSGSKLFAKNTHWQIATTFALKLELSFVLPCPTLSYPVLPCPTLSYLVLPCLTLSYLVQPCLTLSYLVRPCRTNILPESKGNELLVAETFIKGRVCL